MKSIPHKATWKPGTMIYPLPAIMVSCGAVEKDYNIITISWTGTICSDPPMCYISVRKNRYSYQILKETREFVINLTTLQLAKATDWCGVKSGSKYNKFKEMNLTPVQAPNVRAPMILESPVNIECRVFEIKELGTHDMFLANVLAVHADDSFIDPQSGAFNLAKANPIAYSHGQYFNLGKPIGKFGWSVEKKNAKRVSSKK